MIVRTKNLCLIPLNINELELLLTSKEKLIDTLKLNGDLEPLTEEMQTAFGWLYKQCKNYPQYNIWYTVWLIVTKNNNIPVGSFCFKGEPDFNGEVEIGYGIYQKYQEHGYMSETLESLIKWLSGKKDIKALLAETNKKNIPSQKLLIKSGFIQYCDKDNMFWWRKTLR